MNQIRPKHKTRGKEFLMNANIPLKAYRKDHRSDLTQIASSTSTQSLATSGRPIISILFFLKYLNSGYRTAYSARMGLKRHNSKQMHSFSQ